MPLSWPTALRQSPAFTLVELIVVIGILAILGTIGFLSIGGHASNSRDSQRMSDLSGLAKSLDISNVTTGSYPLPDNFFTITYSGGTIWQQWSFGSWAHSKLGGNGINKRPVDPLGNAEYAYSTLAFWKAYSIKANYEGSVTYEFIDSALAASGNPTIAIVRGNYGGLMAKTQTGTKIYVLAIPSILTNTGTAGQSIDISWSSLSGQLLFNGKNLVWASSFNPNVVVFSGTSLPTNDTASGITNMLSSLKTAYASSDLASSTPISTFLSTATGGLLSLGCSIIPTQLEGKACGTPTEPVSDGSWTLASGWDCSTVNNSLGSNGSTSTCVDSRTYNMQWWATHSKTYSIIKIGGSWWFNQNLAYPPATGYQGSSSWATSDSSYYSCPGTVQSSATVNCSVVSSLGYLYQWSSAMAGWISNNNQAARTQGVCPSWWWIPTRSDFSTPSSGYWPDSSIDNSNTGSTVGWSRGYVGFRNNTDATGTFSLPGSMEYFWSSFQSDATFAHALSVHSSYPTRANRGATTKSYGFSVRCIKN